MCHSLTKKISTQEKKPAMVYNKINQMGKFRNWKIILGVVMPRTTIDYFTITASPVVFYSYMLNSS